MGDDSTDTPPDVDADIAAFLASDDAASDPEPDTPAEAVTDDATEEPDGDAPTEPDTAPPAAPAALDVAALTAAAEGDDPAALIKALGDKAETLLGAKAHRALRLQARTIETQGEKAAADKRGAEELERQLTAKYGDPVSARKASADGNVNAFLDMVERWSGRSWNDLQRWVAKGIAGRPEKIELRAPEAQQPPEDPMVKARAEQAQAEVAEWAKRGLVKLAPELDFAEAHELVIAEIREGFAKGINTPAKALPAVRAKLKARYESLHKVFGGKAPPRRETPSARLEHTETPGNTRETSLDEDIADFLRAEGIR